MRARLEQQPVERSLQAGAGGRSNQPNALGPTNARRLIRALEVWEKSGVPLSEQQGRYPPPYRMLIIGLHLDRDVLYARIDERARRMFANGLLDEARALLRYDASLPSMSAIGYREARAVVQGEMSVEEAIAQTSYATHRFARHQQTWYRRFEGVQWFDAEDEGLVERVSDVVDSLVGDADEP
ncbi:MAG: tRNA dimethylallyltransferase [Thermomicrobiales bacterium]